MTIIAGSAGQCPGDTTSSKNSPSPLSDHQLLDQHHQSVSAAASVAASVASSKIKSSGTVYILGRKALTFSYVTVHLLPSWDPGWSGVNTNLFCHKETFDLTVTRETFWFNKV